MDLRLLRNLILVTVLGASSTATAQDGLGALNSIWLDASRADTSRFRALHHIIQERKYAAPPDSLLGLSKQLLRFAQTHLGPLQQGTALNLCGIFHNDLSQWDSAEVAYLQGLRAFEQLADTERMASALNNLGNVAAYKGDQSLSIEYLTRSLRLSEAIGDSGTAARALGNIGVSHFELHEYEVALDYFHRRIALADAIGDKQCALEAWICIGIVHDRQQQWVEARNDFEKSLRLARAIDDVTSIAVAQSNIGRLDVHTGDHERGRAYLDSALRIAQHDSDPMLMSATLTELARSHHLQGDQHKAATYAERALAEARKSALDEVTRDAAEIAYLINKARGRDTEALAMHELFIAMRDSMLQEEDMRSVMSQRFRYEYDKKESALIAEQEKGRLLAALEIAQHKARQRVIIIASVLLVCLALALYFLYRNSQRSAQLLGKKNVAILDAQTKLVESERAREASDIRTRIARDVHDQLGSDLTKLALLSSETVATAATDPAALPTIAKDLERIASEANRSLGDIVWAIDPHHDSLAGLTERVRAHCERMLKWSKVEHTIDCTHAGPDRSLDPATKRDIYLILREALNNAIKYAKAQHVHVAFHTSTTAMNMVVKDDGVGFDPAHGRTAGNGLLNMSERAQRIGATFRIETTTGHGTSIVLSMSFADPTKGPATQGMQRGNTLI